MDSKAIIHKTREDYNRIAPLFSGTRYDLWDELKQFKKLIKNDQNILDWGCGNGRLLFLMKDKAVKYFGLDQSAELLKLANKKWPDDIKSGKVKFLSTASRFPKFDDDFFDLVFLIASYHHLPDTKTRLQLLEKIYEKMKPSAKIVITVWNLESDWAQSKLKKDWKKMGDNDFLIPWKNSKGEMMSERYYHHFSETELRDLLVRAGFKKIDLFYDDKHSFTAKKGGRNLIAIATK
ncbi:MAG: tRNA methyltransferase, catalyzes esterification of modified uridine nucleotides in tRNAs [uncultured bacterium]|nr:MAG: tRNA methyltransferase, catalyzes esterification of modified uridine nucleotides in tRNAs [uncultured bacterium]